MMVFYMMYYFTQAVLAENMLYVSGLKGIDPQEQLVLGGVEQETRQILENLKQILEAAGATLDSVVKTTVYLNDITDYKVVNEVYSEYFPSDCPTGVTYQVGCLAPALGAMVPLVEIDAVAYVGQCVSKPEDGSEPGPCSCRPAPRTPGSKSAKGSLSSIANTHATAKPEGSLQSAAKSEASAHSAEQ